MSLNVDTITKYTFLQKLRMFKYKIILSKIYEYNNIHKMYIAPVQVNL